MQRNFASIDDARKATAAWERDMFTLHVGGWGFEWLLNLFNKLIQMGRCFGLMKALEMLMRADNLEDEFEILLYILLKTHQSS